MSCGRGVIIARRPSTPARTASGHALAERPAQAHSIDFRKSSAASYGGY